MSDFADLMSRDPNKCTKDDVRAIIAAMRAHAANFNNKAAAPKTVKVSAKAQSTVNTLGDLGLKL